LARRSHRAFSLESKPTRRWTKLSFLHRPSKPLRRAPQPLIEAAYCAWSAHTACRQTKPSPRCPAPPDPVF